MQLFNGDSHTVHCMCDAATPKKHHCVFLQPTISLIYPAWWFKVWGAWNLQNMVLVQWRAWNVVLDRAVKSRKFIEKELAFSSRTNLRILQNVFSAPTQVSYNLHIPNRPWLICNSHLQCSNSARKLVICRQIVQLASNILCSNIRGASWAQTAAKVTFFSKWRGWETSWSHQLFMVFRTFQLANQRRQKWFGFCLCHLDLVALGIS